MKKLLLLFLLFPSICWGSQIISSGSGGGLANPANEDWIIPDPYSLGSSTVSAKVFASTITVKNALVLPPDTLGNLWQVNISTAGVLYTSPVAFATGGTVTYDGLYTVHTFLTSGDLTVYRTGDVNVLCVAGGGGGGFEGGGGGGGGVTVSTISLTPGSYPVVIGDGGAGSGIATRNIHGSSGSPSSFSSVASVGGGGGGTSQSPLFNTDGNPLSGGSGGGGAINDPPGNSHYIGAFGTLYQGNKGGDGTGAPAYVGGGGGGALTSGQNGNDRGIDYAGNGGDGIMCSYSGGIMYYGGGGGGYGQASWVKGLGGLGGGGNGNTEPTSGLVNSGGGGGSKESSGYNDGGSGIVIIRYVTP